MTEDWALMLVVKWCEDRAQRMREDAKRVREAYRKGPLPPLTAEFAALLEKQSEEWIAKASGLKTRHSKE